MKKLGETLNLRAHQVGSDKNCQIYGPGGYFFLKLFSVVFYKFNFMKLDIEGIFIS